MEKPEIDLERLKEYKKLLEDIDAIHYVPNQTPTNSDNPKPHPSLTDPYYDRTPPNHGLIRPEDFYEFPWWRE